MNSSCRLLTVALFAFLTLGSCLFSNHYVFAQTDQNMLKLQAADAAVTQAFNAVLEAERAGAKVTSLLAQLNSVQGILAQADNSYRTGDFNTSGIQADSVLSIASQVTALAQETKQTALVSSKNAFSSTIAFTIIGAFIFILALFLIWRRVKRRYINSLSKTEPAVSSQ